MIALFRRLHVATWRSSPLSFALPCLGIAVGVGAIIAIDLGSASTVSSFRYTVERVEGRATHQVVATAGQLRGQLAYELARRGDVVAAAPVLEAFGLLWASDAEPSDLQHGEPLQLIGLDPFAEAGIRSLGVEQNRLAGGSGETFLHFLSKPGALIVSRPFLRRHDLAVGDSLTLAIGAIYARGFVLASLPQRIGELSVPDNLALCDLATAQEMTGRSDVTRIDLVLKGQDASRLAAELPPDVALVTPGGRAERLSEMVAALGTNLRALSYLALFVSLFLIYNAMLLAVLRRRPSIGIARCLGATRGDVLGAWLLEGAVLGAVGVAVGAGLGILGGELAMGGVSRTASGLYGYVRADTLAIVPSVFLKAGGIGLAAAMSAAAWPAAEAARVVPAHTSARGDVEKQAGRVRRRGPFAAIALLGGAIVVLNLPTDSPTPGYAAAVLLALSAGLLTPSAADALLRGLAPGLGRAGTIVGLAARNLRNAMSRTGVALAALSIALSMSIAMGTMVSSFRQEMVDWIGDTVAADIYVSPATSRIERLDSQLPSGLVDELRARESVEAIDTFRGIPVRVKGIETTCAGVDVAVFRRRSLPRVLDGPDASTFLQQLEDGKAGITESLARKANKRAGDTLIVEWGGTTTPVEVAGVYRDYSSDRGVVLLDRARFEELFGPRDANGAALYLAEGQDVEATVTALKQELSSRYPVLIRSNRRLRDEALLVFDRTFAVSRALELIGIAVAAIGILGALLAMLLERRRELATLRACGLSRGGLDRLLLVESAMIATLAWLFALGLGSALAWVLLRVINVRSFGWSLPFALPFSAWWINLGFSLIAAGLATLIPIARSRGLSVAAALRDE